MRRGPVACDAVAFVHGWQDGPDNRTDRHQWIPRAFYALGWRLKRVRLDVARRELEQARDEQHRRAAAFYAELDRAVNEEIEAARQRWKERP